MVTSDIWRAMDLCGWAENGTLPEAGGLLDQTESFLAACRAIWHWQAQAEDKKKKRHG